MKQLEVQIMGQSYLLSCPEGGDARLLDAVERVDTAMCKIRDGGKVRARDRIAVLAALNLAFDLTNRPTPASAAPTDTTQPDPVPKLQAPNDQYDRLESMLARMDAALSGDGHLI